MLWVLLPNNVWLTCLVKYHFNLCSNLVLLLQTRLIFLYRNWFICILLQLIWLLAFDLIDFCSHILIRRGSLFDWFITKRNWKKVCNKYTVFGWFLQYISFASIELFFGLHKWFFRRLLAACNSVATLLILEAATSAWNSPCQSDLVCLLLRLSYVISSSILCNCFCSSGNLIDPIHITTVPLHGSCSSFLNFALHSFIQIVSIQ